MRCCPTSRTAPITLIGATTENPSFEVNSALLSRSRVFVLESLGDDDIRALIERALRDEERGLGKDARRDPARGARRAGEPGQRRRADRTGHARVRRGVGAARRRGAPRDRRADDRRRAAAPRALYDKGGDSHYDTISAFIKTIRGSDPDAAIYWLARMIESGEDPLFIARRLGDPRERGRGPRRPARAAARDRGAAGGALRRDARRLLSARARDALPRDRAQEQHASAVRTARRSPTSRARATIRSRSTCATRRRG